VAQKPERLSSTELYCKAIVSAKNNASIQEQIGDQAIAAETTSSIQQATKELALHCKNTIVSKKASNTSKHTQIMTIGDVQPGAKDMMVNSGVENQGENQSIFSPDACANNTDCSTNVNSRPEMDKKRSLEYSKPMARAHSSSSWEAEVSSDDDYRPAKSSKRKFVSRPGMGTHVEREHKREPNTSKPATTQSGSKKQAENLKCEKCGRDFANSASLQRHQEQRM